MSDFNVSNNMSLPIPVTGVDPGPDWANNLNACLTIVDGHNHSPGSGVQIVPSGININSDLSFGVHNAVMLRSANFSVQPAPLALGTDVGCLYVSGVDLYFNDELGNQVRITQSGGVAGSPGSIAGLASPASATYVAGSQTFVWQSAANTPANMDNGSVILRNLVANSKGLTLNPPAAMGSDYSITLPTLPSVLEVLTLDNSGNMGVQTYDQVAQNMTSVGANAIGVSMTATGADAVGASMSATGANAVANSRTRATGVTVGAGGVAIGVTTGAFTTSSGTFQQVTTCTLTTTGRPVRVALVPDGSGNTSEVNPASNNMLIDMSNASTSTIFRMHLGGNNNLPGSFEALDSTVAGLPGTYTYTAAIRSDGGSGTMFFTYLRIVAYEL